MRPPVGPSDYESRHVAVINYLYELPFFRGAEELAQQVDLGGWQISGHQPVSDRHSVRGYGHQ